MFEELRILRHEGAFGLFLTVKFYMMAFDKDNYFYEGKRMFRKNTSHLQQSLFGIASQLPEAKLKKSKE